MRVEEAEGGNKVIGPFWGRIYLDLQTEETQTTSL